VSIIPRGVGALGYARQRPTEDRFLLAHHDLENRIDVLMGGRAAEALIFDGEVSTGASDDLQRATEIGTQMVTRYGMAETLGPRTYAPPPQPFLTGTMADRVEASEATEREIGIAVRDIVVKAPGKPNSGTGVDKSLPRDFENARNSAVMTAQTVWLPMSSWPVLQQPSR
jgi:cell division protease FtsH